MQGMRLARIITIAQIYDPAHVIDYSDQGLSLEGDFRKMSKKDKEELIKEHGAVKVTKSEIEVEVI